MLGKGDVGRVYLVREKKSSKLYAMKGKLILRPVPQLLQDSV
jgi:protein-serine/threonine kinase